MKRASPWTVAPVLATLFAACTPDFPERTSHVDAPRVLAVRFDPAEAPPGTSVIAQVIALGPSGAITPADAAWATCTTPRLLTENTSVPAACFGDGAATAISGGAPGAAATFAMPSDACSLFGPDVPPGGFRPRDPDATGGYYQPVRLRALDATSFGLARVTCPLANVGADVVADFKARYVANRNPAIAALTLDGASALVVDRGARAVFTASWSAADAEGYVDVDAASQTVVARREAMRVAWYATDGTFDHDVTGRAEDDLEVASDDGWTAPSVAATVHVAVVLHDSRGGVDARFADVVVR